MFFMVPGTLPNWPSTKLGFCPRAKPTLKGVIKFEAQTAQQLHARQKAISMCQMTAEIDKTQRNCKASQLMIADVQIFRPAMDVVLSRDF